MNIVCIGAHPDDCEAFAGGTMVKWARAGHRVLSVSMTNGDAGHYAMGGGPLAKRRAAEGQASAKIAGIEHRILDHHDGELQPTLEIRKEVIRLIRSWGADAVLTHRPNDYHPDHRYTSQLVQDASFLIAVPNYCTDVPHLERNPVFFYTMDTFQKPCPFQPDVAVDITDVMDVKWDMLDAMESQVYEWLPWLHGMLDTVPEDKEERKAWLRAAWDDALGRRSRPFWDLLDKWYGPERAKDVKYAEFFERCEYGAEMPSETDLRKLFPFYDDVT